MQAPDTFLWHDYETFGANPVADRPAQFAAQRTDALMKEVAMFAPAICYLCWG